MIILKKHKIIFLLIILFCNLNCLAADDFDNLMKLAKYSAFKDVVDKMQEQELNGKCFTSIVKSSLFPWRFKITNGYQEGFVYYALLGYANEIGGDIPFAYRCYQNSLSYIDENKCFGSPLPRAEIYLAIGRTCRAAGRYMDAKNWLDKAFLEAGDNLQLQAAIDRVLIRRANEIGDYPEVIFLYQHLEEVSRASLRDSLTKNELANYAQILFYSRKDREGFGKLLEGICNLGIDNDHGVKDPLVNMFLNNITRANDNEVKYFYDLLGWTIVDARAKAGDENYLAFLCNARTLFCKVYGFLNPEDDLKKVKERIDEVKRRIANGKSPFDDEKKYSVFSNRYLRSARRMPVGNLEIDKSGNIEKTPETKLEDLLMRADWLRRNSKDKLSYEYYIRARNMMTNSKIMISYDNVSPEFAAQSGIAFLAGNMLNVITRKSPPIKNRENEIKKVFDFSHESSLRHIRAYCIIPSYAIEYNVVDRILNDSPQAFPPVLNFLGTIMVIYCANEDYKKSFDIFKNIKKRFGVISIRIYRRLGTAYIELDETEKAFGAFFSGLIQHPTCTRLLSPCLENAYWLDKTQIGYYTNVARQIEMAFALKATYDKNNWKWAKAWQDFRNEMALQLSGNFESKPYNEFPSYRSLPPERSTNFINIGDTNGAFMLCLDSLKSRYNIIYDLSRSSKLKFPNKESEIIEKYFSKVKPELQKEYIKLISKSTHSSATNYFAFFLNNNPQFKQK